MYNGWMPASYMLRFQTSIVTLWWWKMNLHINWEQDWAKKRHITDAHSPILYTVCSHSLKISQFQSYLHFKVYDQHICAVSLNTEPYRTSPAHNLTIQVLIKLLAHDLPDLDKNAAFQSSTFHNRCYMTHLIEIPRSQAL